MIQTFVFFLSVLPGAAAWILGRPLIRQAGEPLSPERYVIYWRRIFLLSAACFIVLLVFPSEPVDSSSWSPYPLLLIILVLAGSFPSRKVLLKESWRFWDFLVFYLRFLLAFPAFTILLIITPSIIVSDGGYSVWAIAVLTVLLFGRLFTSVEGVRRILGAQYLTDQALIGRLDSVTARSKVNNPLFMILPLPGGKFANAFALPALPRPAVIFTQPLLDALTPDEADAIYAHELGHLEEMDAAFVKKKLLLSLTLVTAALLAVPALTAFTDFKITPLQATIFGIVLGFMQVKIFGHKRHHEADSDARAVELCGNAEALQNALEILHDINHVPHRWDLNTENSSTHPSLANRIRAIKKSVSAEPENLPEPMLLNGSQPGSFVIFENDSLHWINRVPNAAPRDIQTLLQSSGPKTTWAYRDISELFLKPAGKLGAVLISADHKGNQRKFSLPAEMIAPAKAALAYTDQKISQGGEDNTSKKAWLLAFNAIIIATAYLLELFYPLFTIALLCLFRPGYLTLAALGTLAFGESVNHLLHHPVGFNATGAGMLICMLAGAGAVGYALRQSPKKNSIYDKNFWLLMGLLGFPVVRAVILLTLAAFNGELDLFQLYHITAKNSVATIALLGITGAFLVKFYFRGAWKAALTGLPAIALIFVQSPYFGTVFAHDTFAAKPALLTYRSMALSPIKQTEIPATAYSLRLSPEGSRFAYRQVTTITQDEEKASFIIDDFNHHPSELAVLDLALLDENRFMATTGDYPGRLQLWQLKNNNWTKTKQWQLPNEFFPTEISWNPAQKTWEANGFSYEQQTQPASVSGRIDRENYKVNKPARAYWEPSAKLIWIQDDLLGINFKQKELKKSEPLLPILSFFKLYSSSSYEFWLYKPTPHKIAASAVINLRCDYPTNAGGVTWLTCLFKSQGSTRLGLLNLQNAQLDAVVELADNAAFYQLAGQQDGKTFLTKNKTQLLAVDITKQTAVVLSPDHKTLPIQSTTFSENFAALGFYSQITEQQLVQLYSLETLKSSPSAVH